ncbi:MAG TPA: hypothetical protein VIK91_14445 [Nannocystis sp.]
MATTMRRLDPILADGIRIRAGSALRQVAAPKRLALEIDRSERLLQAQCSGEKPSPVSQCAEMLVRFVRAGLDPWPILTFLRIEALTAMTARSGAALREWLRRVMIEETTRQGELDVLQMQFHPDDVDYLQRLEDAAAAHARRCEEIAVGARMLRREAEERQRQNARRRA